MQLRPYQENIITDLRMAYRKNNSVFMQMPTGAGKTVVISQITKSALNKNFRVWFIVPRNELMIQASEHFYKWSIPHSSIKAGTQESRAFKIHIVSKDTLMRRIKQNKIKNYPDFCIFDEAHVAYDQQKTIITNLPDTSKVLGISATPERTDGRGLSDIYNNIVYGPSIKDLIEQHYLAPFKYFCPPIDGLDQLHRKGSDYDADELEALLKGRAVYGKAIEHYKQYADKKPCIVFCRNIKAAESTAHRFREAGYRFESIDGRMSHTKRKSILDGVKSGKLHGVTSVDLCIYGLDIPRLEVAIMLRPTISKAIYFQQIGRILRPGKNKTAIILDHVNNLLEHGHPLNDHEWLFYGKEKRKKKKGDSKDKLNLCPSCFMYYTGPKCDNCGNQKAKKTFRNLLEVDGRLIEQKGPVPLKDRPYEERKEYHDKINNAKDEFQIAEKLGNIDYKPIEDLCNFANELGYSIMWVYHQLNSLEYAVNVPLLTAIAKVKDYKKAWIYFKRKQLQKNNRVSV
jgi:superfamily II DNA or RNA helicase